MEVITIEIKRLLMLTLLCLVLISGMLIAGQYLFQDSAMAASWKQKGPDYTPSEEFKKYTTAPPITESQKNMAISVAFSSKLHDAYKTNKQGPVTVQWAYPYTGTIHISKVVGSDGSNVYGLLWFDVDNSGNITNEGFNDWNTYW